MKSEENTTKRKRFTKASFRKWCRENPEEARKVYGPWTSLEATIRILQGIQPTIEFKEDGSDILGDLPFEPIDSTEFVCGFAAECGYDFSQPLCETIGAYMKKGSKKTVKELSEVIERAFNDEPFDEKVTEFNNGCRHFECHDAYVQDKQLCDATGAQWGKQICLMCKWWDNAHDGHNCDCTIGKCTYKWRDPNGENQLTFWKEG